MRHLIVALMLVTLVGAGCLTHSYQPMLRYTIDPVIEVSKAEPTARTLGIRTIEADRPYTQKIRFRDPGHVLGQYSLREWAQSPRDVVTRAISDAIVATGRFKDVGDAAYLAQPDLILTGELRKFDEVRTTEPWTAECEVRLELRQSLGPNALWAATLSAQEPLKKKDLSSLAAAMSKAVARIAVEAAEEIAKTRDIAP